MGVQKYLIIIAICLGIFILLLSYFSYQTPKIYFEIDEPILTPEKNRAQIKIYIINPTPKTFNVDHIYIEFYNYIAENNELIGTTSFLLDENKTKIINRTWNPKIEPFKKNFVTYYFSNVPIPQNYSFKTIEYVNIFLKEGILLNNSLTINYVPW